MSSPGVGEPEPMTLRDRRRQETGRDIQRVALQLFQQRGFDDVTVAEISAAAGVSMRTFFRYFPSKDDLLARWTQDWSVRILSGFESAPDDMDLLAAYNEGSRPYRDMLRDVPAAAAALKIIVQLPALRARYLGEHSPDVSDGMDVELARRLGVTPEHPRVRIVRAAIVAASLYIFDIWTSVGGDLESLWESTIVELRPLTDGSRAHHQ